MPIPLARRGRGAGGKIILPILFVLAGESFNHGGWLWPSLAAKNVRPVSSGQGVRSYNCGELFFRIEHEKRSFIFY